MKQLSQTDSLSLQGKQCDTLEQVAQHTTVSVTDTCVQVPVVTGMQGEPLPYKMESDEAVVGAVTVCFVLLLLALQKGSKSVVPFLKEALSLRSGSTFYEERIAISSVTTAALCASTILSSGICLFQYYSISISQYKISHIWIILTYSLAFAVLIIGKSFLYNFVNWIFFNKEKKKQWKQGYWGLIAASGVVLFPTLLYTIFLDSEIQISDILLLMILGIFKILLFYKLLGNFFTRFYGILHLIVYFCALEIIPDLFVWKGVEIFNNLILKF